MQTVATNNNRTRQKQKNGQTSKTFIFPVIKKQQQQRLGAILRYCVQAIVTCFALCFHMIATIAAIAEKKKKKKFAIAAMIWKPLFSDRTGNDR